MPKNPLADLPEVFLSTTALSDAVARGRAQGLVRQLGPRLYTRNLVDPPEAIIRRHLWQVVAAYMPGALIADRTAIENAPAADGSVFVVSARKRDVILPGLTIRPRQGPSPLDSDRPYIGGLHLSSLARAYLDNIAPSRRRTGEVSRTLSRAELENRLDDIVRRTGKAALNSLRDEARRIAPALNRDAEMIELDRLIGALLGTRDAPLETDRAKARGAGAPFDPDRVKLFERSIPNCGLPHRSCARHGSARVMEERLWPSSRPISPTSSKAPSSPSAKRPISCSTMSSSERPADAHDVLGTWRIVSDPVEMTRCPRTPEDLTALLKSRHATLMSARPDKGPGQFKREANRAGQTFFVLPDQVEGTLAQGFDLYRGLETPFARAVYMMFLISEVHPFADGNGRIARIMMNAELVAETEERLVIPTIFRSNYLSALKALSNVGNPRPLVRTLDFAQRWVAALPWTTLAETESALRETNAFMDPGVADDAGIRLQIYDGLA